MTFYTGLDYDPFNDTAATDASVTSVQLDETKNNHQKQNQNTLFLVAAATPFFSSVQPAEQLLKAHQNTHKEEC